MLLERWGGGVVTCSSKYKEEAGAGEVILMPAWMEEEGIYGHTHAGDATEEGVVSCRSHVTRRARR